jgi:lysophospholipase L1-like esterase
MSETARVVLCFGDSNTHGTVPAESLDDDRRYGPDVRWPGILAERLGPTWRLYEEGLPGRTTVHPDPIEGQHLSGIAAVPMLLGTHWPIDAVIIMLGTNDLKARFSVGPSDIAAGVECLVRAIRSLSEGSGRTPPRILLVAPPPVLEVGCLAGMFAGGQPKSEAFGSFLRQTAERLGTGFVDAAEHIKVSQVDGVHFDPDQHRILADVIEEALRALYSQ